MERKLEEAIGALVASYTGETDKEQALKDNLVLVKEVAQVACEIACAAAVAAECSRLGHHKRYEARYFITGKGVNGNLVRSWEVPGLPEDEEGKFSPPPPAYILFLGNSIMLRIGYHVSIAGSMDLAFDRASMIGCTAMQVFLSNPRGWGAKTLTENEIEEFRAKGRKFGASQVFAHMAYLPNIASSNEFAYKKSVEALESSLRRCDLLGIKYLVTHLGSHLGQGREVGFDRAVEAIGGTEGIARNVTLLLENEAGQRNSIGSRVEDLAELRSRIHERASGIRVGFCMDTCHLFEAGYDIGSEKVLGGIFDAIAPGDVHVIHLNDARYPLGRALDRHENIGLGYIGKAGFRVFLNYPSVAGKPMIMETPSRSLQEDRRQIRLVEGLVRTRD
jgi:deoxyribonuclease IV